MYLPIYSSDPRPGSPWKPLCCQRWARQFYGNGHDAWSKWPRGHRGHGLNWGKNQNWSLRFKDILQEYSILKYFEYDTSLFFPGGWTRIILEDLVIVIEIMVELDGTIRKDLAFECCWYHFERILTTNTGIWSSSVGDGNMSKSRRGIWGMYPTVEAKENSRWTNWLVLFRIKQDSCWAPLFTHIHQGLEGMGLDQISALIDPNIGCFSIYIMYT